MEKSNETGGSEEGAANEAGPRYLVGMWDPEHFQHSPVSRRAKQKTYSTCSIECGTYYDVNIKQWWECTYL